MTNKGLRNIEIEKERESGDTYAVIARRHGISKSRVQQILARQERNRRVIQDRLSAPLRGAT